MEFRRMGSFAWDTPLTTPITTLQGGGPFGLLAGQITDDTHMACCLAASLKENDGLDLDDVANKYVSWRRVTFDCGGQTSASLGTFARDGDATTCGTQVWLRSGKNGAGNGSLMRASPIGVFFAEDPEMCLQASIWDAQLTHFDPRCVLACAAYNAAIAGAVSGRASSVSDMLQAARQGLREGLDFWHANFVPEFKADAGLAYDALVLDLEMACHKDPDLYGSALHLSDQQGFVRVAFRLAFWELMHAQSFESALLDVVNRGGDSDTNGAIAGGLLGAYFGFGAIPAAWSKQVLECDPRAPFHAAGALHPNRLMDMLAVLTKQGD
jgi:ADP-ribosyl-[dinitrogen reductase] hydrolase